MEKKTEAVKQVMRRLTVNESRNLVELRREFVSLVETLSNEVVLLTEENTKLVQENKTVTALNRELMKSRNKHIRRNVLTTGVECGF